MALQLEATYENGVFKLDEVPPLKEHERVTITVQPQTSRARQSFGMIGWTGAPQVLRQIAENVECGLQESP
jgi:predicted DNA-binding antitoxin AbrB/MazE fold protein